MFCTVPGNSAGRSFLTLSLHPMFIRILCPLRSIEETGALRGFVSHLLFADDSLLFAQAHMSQAAKFKDNFTIYEDCSGQTINYDKSSLFFSKGASDSLRQEICFFSLNSSRKGK